MSTATPIRSIAGQQVHQRQLDAGQQPGAAALLQLVVERLGEVEDRPGLQHRRVPGGVLPHRVEGELAVVGGRPGLAARA